MYSRQFLAAVLLVASTATAQSAATHIAMGDTAYAALNPAGALSHYTMAIAVDPKNIDALWKASQAAVTLGEFSDSTRDTLYAAAQSYGHRAVAMDSMNVNAQFALAQALGRIALTITNPVARVPYGRGTYEHATACLKLNPDFVECAHVLGVWHAEVMRTDENLRNMAISMLGEEELSHASWANAQRYLQQAVIAQPKRAVHHLDLARIYADMGKKAKARAEYKAVLQAPVTDYNDTHYKAVAQAALNNLRSN